MKKLVKRILKIITIILITVVFLVLLINIPIIHFGHKATEADYSNWMSENLDDELLVKNIAMLGAHDAFANEINIFSKLDPYENNSIMQGFTGFLVKGFIVKQSVTQISEASILLDSGVRYLDIRLTYDEDTWWTKHNYISGEFSPIASEIKSFLDKNPGEFLILDFQHINGVDYNDEEDLNLFMDMLLDYDLLDFAYQVDDLDNLAYGEITNSGTESKVIIISKFNGSTTPILKYTDSVRSNWADSDDFEYILDFLQEEANEVESQNITDRFRVMQAVSTMQMDGKGILKALTSWSLINRARNFNNYLLEYNDFDALLPYLPIIMVDYADNNYQGFNDNLMEIIIDFNQN